MSDTNQIPMQQGVRVNSPGDPNHEKVGTTISRPSLDAVEVDFGEGVKATYHQNELVVL